MKTALVSALLLAVVATSPSLAADVNVLGDQTPMLRSDVDVRVASKDLLNNPTALANKNTLATDNNVFIAKSNVVFTQNDRLAMREKVKEALGKGKEQAMATATLTKNVMRAVSTSDNDAAIMRKASAVVAAKDADASTLSQRIADFVDAVGQKEIDVEQAIQSETPRGVMVLVGTKDLLRQPTGVVNKNMAASDNQVAVSNSHIMPTQNDQIVLTSGAKVADAILPASAISVDKVVKMDDASEDAVEADAAVDGQQQQFRQAFVYRKGAVVGPRGAASRTTVVRRPGFPTEFWGAGWGMGWRYPLGYWNTFGAGLMGGSCGLGFVMGPFYYC